MLAQLQNQDPTSPIDSNAFLTQLAQLSEVQGIQNLNSSFSTLSNSLVSSQALQASSLLGHQALVGASGVNLATAGAAVSGAVAVPQTSSDVTVNISNSAGELVGRSTSARSRPVSPTSRGTGKPPAVRPRPRAPTS